MKKKPIATIRLTLLANRAAPSPLLGQALGQYGINIMEFCKNFNNQTKMVCSQVYIPTHIYLYSRDSFQVIIKTPSTSYLIKQVANISKGSALAKKNNLEACIFLKEIYHLAIFKKCDRLLNHLSLKALCKTLIGSAKSMGIGIANEEKSKKTQI
jgi:large subunit ribosomal protein L11